MNGKFILPAVLLSCSASGPPRVLSVDLIVRDVSPARVPLASLPDLSLRGSGFCENPAVTINNASVRAKGGADAIVISDGELKRALQSELDSVFDCENDRPIPIVVDCAGQRPLGTDGRTADTLAYAANVRATTTFVLYASSSPLISSAEENVSPYDSFSFGFIGDPLGPLTEEEEIDARVRLNPPFRYKVDVESEGLFVSLTKYRLTPLEPLPSATTFEVAVKTGTDGFRARDNVCVTGNQGNYHVWSFTTRPAEEPPWRMWIHGAGGGHFGFHWEGLDVYDYTLFAGQQRGVWDLSLSFEEDEANPHAAEAHNFDSSIRCLQLEATWSGNGQRLRSNAVCVGD